MKTYFYYLNDIHNFFLQPFFKTFENSQYIFNFMHNKINYYGATGLLCASL